MTDVFYDQTTDGGGWTVVQRRTDGSQNFFCNWTEYKNGFGKLNQQEHWLEKERIHYLTAQAFLKGSEARFDLLVKGESKNRWVKYSRFSVGDESTGFIMHVSGFTTGGVTDRFAYHNGMRFTTYDRDHDTYSEGSCAYWSYEAWWHNNCNYVNINGQYDRFNREKTYRMAFQWNPHRLKYSEMKIRRK